VLVHATAIVGLKCSFHCFITIIFITFSPIWGAKVLISFELRKKNTIFFTFYFSLFTFFRTFARKIIKKQFLIGNMINSQDIKKGTAIRMDGGIWVCIDFQHRKPGKGNTIMIIKVKNVSDGRVLERRFNIGEKLEDVVIERRPYQYLYEDQSGRIFMNQETFEQIPIDNELVIGHEFMKESDIVEVVSDTTDGTILYAEMPVKTVLRVTHSEPGVKGDTATNTLKPATLETGVEVRVPLFINEGDLIQVDTRDGSYLQRVKE
jgi:elongation factor P